VRGRTPSLDDPYVWFDPIHPERPQAQAEAPAAEAEGADVVRAEEAGGERPGRSRRRRGRGRGRERNGDTAHELKVEARATAEGMPVDGSPDDAMAARVEAEEAPPALPEEPRRRRVRRKTSASATAHSAVESAVEPNEVERVGEAVVMQSAAEVEPEAAAPEATAAEPAPETPAEPAPVAPEPVVPQPAPEPEVDVAALIAEDPNQILAPPEKPKRGWWRR
jgi:ribonuclease E